MNDHINSVCKIGQGELCCKYLTIDRDGFNCAKVNTEWRDIVGMSWTTNSHIAQGDNCQGMDNLNTQKPIL